MSRVLVAALVAMIIAILSGPTFIAFLRRNEFGQHIREDGPERHLEKQGTPTMGGLLVVLAASLAFLPLTDFTLPALTIFGTTLACAAIGFLDDLQKLRHRRSLGLRGRWKILMLVGVTAAVGFAAHHQHLPHSVFIPVVDWYLPLGPFWYGLLFLIIAGAVNGVNLTDGLDGLAIGSTLIAAVTYTILTYAAGNFKIADYLRIAWVPQTGELAVFCGAMVGASLGFLWFNAHPAEIFMGDVGSLALGGAIGTLAVAIKQEILLVFVGGLFVIEALSVMIQVASFKLTGRRVFKMSPLHHHFELSGWRETKVVVRFWIIAIIFALMSLATLKLR